MKRKKWIDPDMPVGKLTPVPDFLPPPEELFPPNERLKVTLELDAGVIKFFKSRAKRHGGKYQRMMREVLRRYAAHHQAA